jgi:hypothetical protein
MTVPCRPFVWTPFRRPTLHETLWANLGPHDPRHSRLHQPPTLDALNIPKQIIQRCEEEFGTVREIRLAIWTTTIEMELANTS